MLKLEQLKHFFSWCKLQRDKKGRDLLERARAYLLEHPTADKYSTVVEVLEETDKDGFQIIEWSCSCPQGQKTKAPICKHAVALVILQNRQVLEEKSSKWREFFKQYDRAHEEALKKALEDFGNF